MAGIALVLLIVAGVCVGFVLYYKFFYEKKIDRREVIDMLRAKGIADKPETIVRQYYKTQQRNLDEKEVKKLTNDYIRLQKDFFLTMWESIKHKERAND